MKRTTIVLSALLCCLGFKAYAGSGWEIQNSMQAQVQAEKVQSPVLIQVQAEAIADLMVYSANAPDSPLIQLYDLIACLQLTNPTTIMAVNQSDGYNITMNSVTFPGGNWGVQIKLKAAQQINELDTYPVYLLDQIIIGTLNLQKKDQRIRALRQISKSCYS